MKLIFNKYLFLFLSVILLFCCEQQINENSTTSSTTTTTIYKLPKSKSYWTFIFYYNGDNDLLDFMVSDIQEIKSSLTEGENISVVVLFDSINLYESNIDKVFGEKFYSTRIYEILSNKIIRREGFEFFPEITLNSDIELNLGDINNLKKFINYCKKYFPADKYGLFIGNHGSGIGDIVSPFKKAISYDQSSNYDFISIGQFTDILTKDQSVDIIVFDACNMGYIEIAYQLSPLTKYQNKFYANVMVASAPEENAEGLKYDNIFKRINSNKHNFDNGEQDLTNNSKEFYYSAKFLDPEQLGAIIIEEQRDRANELNSTNQCYVCLDLTKSEILKNKIDNISKKLVNYKSNFKQIIGTYPEINKDILYYFNNYKLTDWRDYSSFDIYSIFNKISNSNYFSFDLTNDANDLLQYIDDFILYSYGGSQYKNFIDGKNGVAIFFPYGDKLYNDKKYWSYQIWYNSKKLNINSTYGNLIWCFDNCIENNNTIENWFELLDYWFDDFDDNGGFNFYKY